MGTITCVGRDGGSRTYEYSVTRVRDEWLYRVRSTPPPTSGGTLELTVKEVSDTEVMVTMMHHHWQPEYAARGIPDALLPRIREELEQTVASSPSAGSGNVYRTPDATKVWERLKNAGIASYSESEDVYRIS